MERRRFGPTSYDVPFIGQGTWQMEGDDRPSCVRSLQAGLDLGLTHIDTAELYGGGSVEAIVADAITGRRDEVFLVSKVRPDNASRAGAKRACERSLRHLHTDHLDCYLLHWPGEHPLEDTIAAFEALVDEGKIRSWGVSNFDEQELESALAIAGPGKIACNQVLYHLAQRDIENAVLPWCEANAVAVVGYTPFGRSRFPPMGPAGQALTRVASKHGATPRQVALAFLTRRPSLFAIPKSSNADHVAENARAAALTLDDADLKALDTAFPVPTRRAGVPML